MEPERKNLLELLRTRAGAQFVIPPYQRYYTWRADKDVDKFLNDLKSLIEGKFSQHFFGILIYLDVTKKINDPEYSLIDGQQRLTTTFLFLYALKYLSEENIKTEKIEKKLEKERQSKNPDETLIEYLDEQIKMPKQIETSYLINDKSIYKNQYRLKPLVADNNVYEKIVKNEIGSLTDAEKNTNIFRSFEYIKNYLKTEFLANGITFEDILEALNKFYLVIVPIDKDDYPQKIFESINATGVKLSGADLIRNFILMDLEIDEQDRFYKTYWKEVESLISRDSNELEDFFRFFLASKTFSLPNKNLVYDVFKSWFIEQRSTKSIEDCLKEIYSYANYYNNLFKKNLESVNEDIREKIIELRDVKKINTHTPFLLELYSLYYSKKITAEQFNDVTGLIINYLFRRSICGLPSNVISRLFPSLLQRVLKECDADKDYASILENTILHLVDCNKAKGANMPDDDELKDLVRYANVYTRQEALVSFFRKLERASNVVIVDFSCLSIEHLMPQTPTVKRYKCLGIDENEYYKYLNRLGNLTLVAKKDNSAMGNTPFTYKQEVLNKSGHLIINQEILKKSDWTTKEIDDRTEELLNEMIRLYPYPTSTKKTKTRNIYLDDNVAEAVYYERTGNITILAGSVIKNISNLKNPIKSLYNKLLEEEIIEENGDQAIFIEEYTIASERKDDTALSKTACLLLGGSKNGWDYWKNKENGKPLSDCKDLEKLYNK